MCVGLSFFSWGWDGNYGGYGCYSCSVDSSFSHSLFSIPYSLFLIFIFLLFFFRNLKKIINFAADLR